MEWIGDIERAFAALIYPNRVMVAIAAVAAVVTLAWIARRRGLGRHARSHPRAAIGILVLALVVTLPLGWYLASPLALSKTIDEPAPIVAAASATPLMNPSPGTTQTTTPTDTTSPSPSPFPTPVPLARSGAFKGADDFHFGRGTANLIKTAPGVFVVRLEDFEVRNGPDLFVYLSPASDGYAKGAIELGALKADKGNQNYDVPVGVDPAAAGSVVIWCRQFSVLFATAPLGT